jgi:hypothetical protein
MLARSPSANALSPPSFTLGGGGFFVAPRAEDEAKRQAMTVAQIEEEREAFEAWFPYERYLLTRVRTDRDTTLTPRNWHGVLG